jgi:hypothetical protein
MRPLILLLLAAAASSAASYTSTATGNWNSSATWGGSGFPGSGDTATIADGHVVTCPTSVTCIAGTNTAAATAITIGQAAANPSTAKLIVAGTLIVRGNVLANPVGLIRTTGYCALTLNAGSAWTFDSSLTSPTSTTYSFNAAANYQEDAVICANGTANSGDSTGITTGGNHVTINSNAGGGNGFITTTYVGAWEHTITYADFTNIGDATHPAIYIYSSLSASTQLFTLDHSTFTHYGGVSMVNQYDTSNWSITHNVWSYPLVPANTNAYCATWASPTAGSGATVRLISNNYCDSGFGTSYSNPTWAKITYSTNVGGPTTANGDDTNDADKWASYSNSVLMFTAANNGGGFAGGQSIMSGSADGVYYHEHTNLGHYHWMQAISGSVNQSFTHEIFDADVTVNQCIGNDISFPSDIGVGTNMSINFAIVLPPATQGCSTGGIVQPLGRRTNTQSLDHITDFAQQGLNLADTDGSTGEIIGLTNSLFWVFPNYNSNYVNQNDSQYPGVKAADVGSAGEFGRAPGICEIDLISPPSAADFNAGWNIFQAIPPSATGCTNPNNSGRGYFGNWSATPGAHDIVISDPLFVDVTRNLATYDTGGLSHAAGAAWSAASSYTVGQIVSHPVAAFYGGATINFRCIKAHAGFGIAGATNNLGIWASGTTYPANAIVMETYVSYISIAGANVGHDPAADTAHTYWAPNTEPGSIGENTTAGWRDYWEPASFNDIRNGLYSGATVGGLDAIAAMRAWVTAGFAPQNRALCGAAADGSDIGAVPCAPTLPLQITGASKCQEAQTCSYAVTGGTPPYTYSLVSGSVGSVAQTLSKAAYTAPSSIVPNQTVNGCQMMPNNSVFNTRIDSLPVHANNTLWMSNIDPGGSAGFGSGQLVNGSVVHSTDQAVGLNFDYSPNPPIVVKSYAMLNGMSHHDNYYDAAYAGADLYGLGTGSGLNYISMYPLAGGTGYLTDGVVGASDAFADPAKSPYTVTGAAIVGGNKVLTLNTGPATINVGDNVTVTGVNSTGEPSGGFNGFIVVTAVDTTAHTITYGSGVDPGTWTGGGTAQPALPESVQAPNWVMWAINDLQSCVGHSWCVAGADPIDTNDTFATIVFQFAVASSPSSVQLYVANSPLGLFNVFGTVTVDFSNDGITYVDPVTYTSTSGDRSMLAGYVTVPLNQTNAYLYARIHMTHQGYTPGSGVCNSPCLDWLDLSEVKFFGNASPFIFQAFPNTISQAGTEWTYPGLSGFVDNHYFTTVIDTCKQEELYKYYATGAVLSNPAINSASGIAFDMESHVSPGYGINAAEMPITPVMTHQKEILAAEAGDLNAIKHAGLVTLSALSIANAAWVWPAQGYANTDCGVTNVTANGTSTVTAYAGGYRPVFYAYPTGMSVTINGNSYTVVSVTDSTHMVVSGTVTAGSYAMTQPQGNCVPYGTRLRLKAAFTFPGGDYATFCNTACQNIVAAEVNAQKHYGLIVTDVGTAGEGDGDQGYTDYNAYEAAESAISGLFLNPTNYEIVDESSLQTSQTGGAPDPLWLEAKIDNGYVVPAGGAVITVTDSASATARFSVALQGVGVGVEHNNELVMQGAGAFQLNPWVTGSSSGAFTCALSPSGSVYGTITSGCLYTPPSTYSTSIVTTTATVTASADTAATSTIAIQIIPVAADGKLYISTGKIGPTGTPYYSDTAGTKWWNDAVQELSPALFPDDPGNNYCCYGSGTWTDYAGTLAYTAQSPSIYTLFMTGGGQLRDHHFRFHVPNGAVTGTLLVGDNYTAAGQGGFGFDCNGVSSVAQSDFFTFIGATHVIRPIACAQTVSNGILHMALRTQGTGPHASSEGAPYDNCGIPCYRVSNNDNLVAGIVVQAVAGAPPISGTVFSGTSSVGGQVVVH